MASNSITDQQTNDDDNNTNLSATGIQSRRDHYQVLNVSRDASHQQIKSAAKQLMLKYHPDKNPEATELFNEVLYSYGILSDSEKRKQYDNPGSEALDAEGTEVDLSNTGVVRMLFYAVWSTLGSPTKTKISANVLKETLNATFKAKALPVGASISGKVNKQCADFFSVTISEEEAQSGIVVRVTSNAQSKFKLLYFEQVNDGGYSLASREDSEKNGKMTSAGMYFLHFQVYRMDPTVYESAFLKDPEGADFKLLEGLQPCELSELKSGTHIFAVYGDNFFQMTSYTIEAMCATTYEDTTRQLNDIEQHIWRKRTELCEFETEYRQAVARFIKATGRRNKEKHDVAELLKRKASIQSSFTVGRSLVVGSGSNSQVSNGGSHGEVPGGEGETSNGPN